MKLADALSLVVAASAAAAPALGQAVRERKLPRKDVAAAAAARVDNPHQVDEHDAPGQVKKQYDDRDPPNGGPARQCAEVLDALNPEPAGPDPATNPDLVPKPRPVPKKYCATFDPDASDPRYGFKACPGYFDNIIVRNSANPPPFPLPSSPDSQVGPGGGGDRYLHLRDRSGASLACGQTPELIGDWSGLPGCSKICFDMRIFFDGCSAFSLDPRCIGTPPHVPITPKLVIQGGPPEYYRAVFGANLIITDDDGPNPGWHTNICAPIGPLDSSGNLPSNGDGTWAMAKCCDLLSGSPCSSSLCPTPPNSVWPTLLSNVEAIVLVVDYTSNPAERFGYDNICIFPQSCPKPVCDPKPLCYWKYEWDCKYAKRLRNWPQVLKKLQIQTFGPDVCVCEVLEKCCPDRCDMAEQELMALLLNVASGYLDPDCCVDTECGGKVSNVMQLANQADELLQRSSRTDYDCAMAMELITGINDRSHGKFCD